MFLLIQRHAECFQNRRSFSWLDDLEGPETLVQSEGISPSSAAEASSPDQPTAQPFTQNSYFAEFEQEAEFQRARQQNRETAQKMWGRRGGANDANGADAESRSRDDDMAELYSQLAEREIGVSDVLFKAREWAACVWHAQQAVELMVKALMFRTCGITDTEHKGPGAHDVAQMLARLIKHPDVWPAPRDAVEELSKAYIDARYSTVALTGFTETSATRARSTAEAVLDWARVTDFVREPSGRARRPASFSTPPSTSFPSSPRSNRSPDSLD